MLTKNFLGSHKTIAFSSNGDNEDLDETISFKNVKPSNDSNIKLLKQSNPILTENKEQPQNDQNVLKTTDEPKKSELTGIFRTLLKKIVSFFGKRNHLSKRDKAFIRTLINLKSNN